MGRTRAIALPRMYKTPKVPHTDAITVAGPVTGHLVSTSNGLDSKVVTFFLEKEPPPRGRVMAAFQDVGRAEMVGSFTGKGCVEKP
jgi:hypothetical protein